MDCARYPVRIFSLEALSSETICGPGSGVIAVYSARSPEKDTPNEDAAAVMVLDESHLVLAVADGVGGHPSGDQASALALSALLDAVREAGPERLREGILSGFDRANRSVIALGSGAATTLVAVTVEGRRARSYHVGDSAVLAFGGRGKLRLQTIPHSPVGYAVEAGVLDEQDAMEHEDRNLVSNVIGDRDMHVGMSSAVRLRPRDTLVLASDGLFDNLYGEEIVQRLRRGPLDRAVAALAEEARARMASPRAEVPSKPDDLTMVAYRPGASPVPPPASDDS